MAERYELGPQRSQGLVDILDRILDKGLVIAGDIRVRLADVELLTIQIRLLVCSVDKAEEIGMNWWRTTPFLSVPEGGQVPAAGQMDAIRAQLDRLESRLAALEPGRRAEAGAGAPGGSREESHGESHGGSHGESHGGSR